MTYRSKTVAAWLALTGGVLGLHRLYLHGLRDPLAWLHWLPTAAGLTGVARLRNLGQDDPAAWLLIPVLGLTISVVMLTAIVYALTPDERWDARHNPGQTGAAAGWGAVLAAIAALLLGGATLMGSVAYGGQMYFEWALRAAQTLPPAAPGR